MSKIITVDFHSDTLFAVKRDDVVYVVPKPICDSMGIEWRKQQERIRRDPILSEGITMAVIPSPGGAQETTLLRLDLVNGWLFGIDESRVKDEETRQRVLTYKRECYRVLFEHFYGKGERQPDAAQFGADPRSDEPTVIKRSLVTECRQTFDHQAARELWFKLGLPVVPSMLQDPRQGALFSYTAIKTATKKDEDPEAA